MVKDCNLQNGILKYNQKIWVPEKIKYFIILYYHTHALSNHQGVDRTLSQIQRRFYWPGIKQDTQNQISACHICQLGKRGKGPEKYFAHTWNAEHPMQIVQWDSVGPLPESSEGHKYILTIMDRFSNFVKAVPIHVEDAATVSLKLLNEWICQYGCMDRLLSDRGSEFLNDLCKNLFDILKVKQSFTTSFYPQCNGKLERWHKFLKEQLTTITLEKGYSWDNAIPWHSCLPSICCAYNSTPNSVTHVSPHEILFGQKFKFPKDINIDNLKIPNNITDKQSAYYEAIKPILKNIKITAQQNQKTYDERRMSKLNKNRKKHPFQNGDLILIDNTIKGRTKDKYHKTKWDGPWCVVKYDIGKNRMQIRNCNKFDELQIINVNKCKLYKDDQSINNYKIQAIKPSINTSVLFWESFFSEYSLLDLPSYRKNKNQIPPSTPRALAYEVSKVANKYGPKQMELMSGSGEITEFLLPNTIAIEINKERARQCALKVPQSQVLICDLKNQKTLQKLILQYNNSMDCIVSNPQWDMSLQALRLASILIKRNNEAKIVFLLPSNFFTTSKERLKKYEQLPLNLVKQIQIGRWNYYWQQGYKNSRMTDDSIFIFKFSTVKLKSKHHWAVIGKVFN